MRAVSQIVTSRPALTTLNTTILDESCTLIFSAVTKFTPAICLQDSLTIVRIPQEKMSKIGPAVSEKIA